MLWKIGSPKEIARKEEYEEDFFSFFFQEKTLILCRWQRG
jgi:hypothetical protein